jgi:hypothetical protein
MNNSRRNFLGKFATSVAAFVSFRTIGAAQTKSSRSLPSGMAVASEALARLDWNSFYHQLDTEFEFSLRGLVRARRPSRLRLAAIKSMDPDAERGACNPRCFVLNFTGRTAPLGQDTYAVNHPVLGRFDLFISEASVTEGEYTYTAVINRLVG